RTPAPHFVTGATRSPPPRTTTPHFVTEGMQGSALSRPAARFVAGRAPTGQFDTSGGGLPSGSTGRHDLARRDGRRVCGSVDQPALGVAALGAVHPGAAVAEGPVALLERRPQALLLHLVPEAEGRGGPMAAGVVLGGHAL